MRVRMGPVAVCAVVNVKRRHGDHGEKPLLRAFNRGFHAINDRQLFGREYLSRSGKSANGAVAQHEELVGESSREHQVVNNAKRKGTPTIDVMMPTGSMAPVEMNLERSEESRRIAPPKSMLAGMRKR